MASLKIFNTMTRKIEEFVPIKSGELGMYTCGPTVYDFMTIGNWRTFVFEDFLRRTLEFDGFKVTQVMNVTDVGHLTGDNVGNADLGEDRMEKAAKRENKTAWDVAQFYLDDFVTSRDKLNILAPQYLPRATEHIKEQIELIQKLENKGLTYATKLGVYFDVSKFPDYGKLGGQKLVDKRNASREELVDDPEKKSAFDFALWKFSPEGEKRQMEWESPWGMGFPGWHIECSAMSMKYLGETLDIHTGGVDHIAIHHSNEIAQSEGATGKKFVNFWVHGEFLTVDGGRMGKSLGNAYNLQDIIAKGYDPLALRYFFLGAHYRTLLNFTWEGLKAAALALRHINDRIAQMASDPEGFIGSGLDLKTGDLSWHKQRFVDSINDDLNIPNAVGALQVLLSDKKIVNNEKLKLVLEMDGVFGLKLEKAVSDKDVDLPEKVKELFEKRENLRSEKKFEEADLVRKEIESAGFVVEDTKDGAKVRKLN